MTSTQTLNKLERATVKRIFQEFLIRKHCKNIEHLTLQHAPYGNFKVIPYIVESPLSSSSLLTSQIVHYGVRNFLPPMKPIIKEFLQLTYEKNQNWNYVKDQSTLFKTFTTISQETDKKLSFLESLKDAFPHDLTLQSDYEKTHSTLSGIRNVLQAMEPARIKLNAFPVNGVADNKMRGMMIQIKGANKGARTERYKSLVGNTEIHSEKMRVYEFAKETWLSRIGTFGLKITTVYGNLTEFADKNVQLRNGKNPFKVQSRNWLFE